MSMISSKAAFVLTVGEGLFLSGFRGVESSSVPSVRQIGIRNLVLACKQCHHSDVQEERLEKNAVRVF
jgi:hypothetical protein